MNGKVYIASGHQNQTVALGTCEIYNPVTNEWQLMPSLKVPRICQQAWCAMKECCMFWEVLTAHPGYYQLKYLMQSKMNGERDHLYQLIALKQVRKRNRNLRINLKLVLQDFARM